MKPIKKEVKSEEGKHIASATLFIMKMRHIYLAIFAKIGFIQFVLVYQLVLLNT